MKKCYILTRDPDLTLHSNAYPVAATFNSEVADAWISANSNQDYHGILELQLIDSVDEIE